MKGFKILAISYLQFWSFKFSNVLVPVETVISGCFWVVFLSILFENLTSDNMQDDASDMLQF